LTPQNQINLAAKAAKHAKENQNVTFKLHCRKTFSCQIIPTKIVDIFFNLGVLGGLGG